MLRNRKKDLQIDEWRKVPITCKNGKFYNLDGQFYYDNTTHEWADGFSAEQKKVLAQIVPYDAKLELALGYPSIPAWDMVGIAKIYEMTGKIAALSDLWKVGQRNIRYFPFDISKNYFDGPDQNKKLQSKAAVLLLAILMGINLDKECPKWEYIEPELIGAVLLTKNKRLRLKELSNQLNNKEYTMVPNRSLEIKKDVAKIKDDIAKRHNPKNKEMISPVDYFKQIVVPYPGGGAVFSQEYEKYFIHQDFRNYTTLL